jgi:hypothetical protein
MIIKILSGFCLLVHLRALLRITGLVVVLALGRFGTLFQYFELSLTGLPVKLIGH